MLSRSGYIQSLWWVFNSWNQSGILEYCCSLTTEGLLTVLFASLKWFELAQPNLSSPLHSVQTPHLTEIHFSARLIYYACAAPFYNKVRERQGTWLSWHATRCAQTGSCWWSLSARISRQLSQHTRSQGLTRWHKFCLPSALFFSCRTLQLKLWQVWGSQEELEQQKLGSHFCCTALGLLPVGHRACEGS